MKERIVLTQEQVNSFLFDPNIWYDFLDSHNYPDVSLDDSADINLTGFYNQLAERIKEESAET